MSLQEEHTDLLGLLAQQDVELSVYRSTLEQHLGTEGVHVTDEQARDAVSNKYGAYIDVRHSLQLM